VQARKLCPDGVFLRGDMRRYARESRRIFAIFRRFTPLVEGLSLDEAFLDATGTERLFGPAAQVASRLRAAVREETGLAVSVGIAPVKMVAKIASDLAKPDGLLEVRSDGLQDFLEPLPVGCIWGVGAVARQRLAALEIETVGDLARMDATRLESALGRWGLEVARLARGEDLREVEPFREPVSYSEENTFAADVADRVTLEATIVAHADAVARRLRRDGLAARTVVLKLKLARRVASGPRGYPILTRRRTLERPTDDGQVLSRAAAALLQRAALREPVRLLGVGATNLVATGAGQLDLFAAGEGQARRARLNRALDEIQERFGARSIVRGALGEAERAGLSQQIKRGAPED
jgi:DNA polymerase-4